MPFSMTQAVFTLSTGFVLLVACGGDGDSTGVDTDTDAVAPIANLCEDIPTFDIAGASCDVILSSYEQTVGRADACNTTADCQVLDARCDTSMTGTCFVVVNSCLDQGDVNVFADAYGPGCNTDGRDGCPAAGCPLPDFECVGGVCAQILPEY